MASTIATGAPGAFASVSLYVGDLHPDATENDLNEKFSQAGDIASIRLCRDSVTRRSLGYAYVNYHESQSAERAITSLNFADIRGRQVRVCWSQRDPSVRRSGAGNTFVKNLPESIDNQKFYNAFSTFGNIISSRVCFNRDSGKPLGFGFVQFESPEDAQKAIEATVTIDGQVVNVAAYKSSKDRTTASNAFTNIYVKNLPAEWSKADLDSFFGQYGSITSSVLLSSSDSKSQGLSYGFVNFASHEEAQNAIEKANIEVNGKKVYAVRALKKADRERQKAEINANIRHERHQKYAACNLYVKLLPEDVTEDKVKEVFGKYGNITSSRLQYNNENRFTGVAYVCYTSPDEATKAINDLNQSTTFGRPIYVALHQPKAFRAHQQRQQEMWGPARGFYGHNRMVMVPANGMKPHFYGGMQQQMGYHPAMARPHAGQRMARGPAGGQPRAPRAPGHAGPQGQTRRRPRPQPAGYVFNEAEFAALPPQNQKNYLGELLYPKVAAIDAEKAPKITGMLIEMDVNEVLKVVHNEDALRAKVSEAIAILRDAGNDA